MSIISNIKNKYRVNKNIVWFVNTVFISVTAAASLFALCYFLLYVRGVVRFAGAAVMALSVILDIISLVCNRRFINTPISVAGAVGIAVAAYMMYVCLGKFRLISLIPAATLVLDIIVIIMQWHIRKSQKAKDSLVKIAKVKFDFDFTPDDVIEDYRIALEEIEKKYDMGNEDRAAFENEKEELLADTHQILKTFVGSPHVGVLDKISTLEKAKRECILSEDNFLLWKNAILKDEGDISAIRDSVQEQFDRGVISQEEYQYRKRLLDNEI